jgi:hypothetical protein
MRDYRGNCLVFLTNGAETGQFLQLTRIKSWDNIEKIGIIPTDYKKLVEDKR